MFADIAPGLGQNLWVTAAVLLACVLALWLASIRLKDVSIIDIFWGPAFGIVALVGWFLSEGHGVDARRGLVTALTVLWAARLGVYLFWRNHGKGEDPRYTAAFRNRYGSHLHWHTLTKVFLLQGALAWLISTPVQLAQYLARPETLGIAAYAGTALWIVGFTFETVADWQLARFKADPANRGAVMDRGLWRYSRHPNYFGNACLWWGLWLIACDHPLGLATVFSPLLMTHFLLNVTGKKLLEKRMTRARPAYAEYVARTPGFFPGSRGTTEAGPCVYRIVQWATGSMGRTALRRIIEHPDLELVGVYVYDERKVGVDAGEISRRPATGVRATHRIEDVLALQPDVVLHMSRITEPYDRQNADVATLLGAGIDVISTAGFHHPACHGIAYAGPLREACRRGGSTLAGVGLNPGFIAERIATTLTGMCARLDSVACFELADASHMPSPEFVFGLMGLGANPEQRDITREPIATMYDELFMEVLHAVADALGTRVASLVPEHSTTPAPRDLSIRAGTIRRGTVAATDWRWRARLESGVELVHSVTWTADPALQGATGRDAAAWRIEIRGRPTVRATIAIEDPDPGAPHMRAAVDAVVAIALNAIPAVAASPPGFFAFAATAPYRLSLP